ncbi:hypothetical protein SALWKB2_1894 [Snodgrassella alvi wkB2]|uniref:Uncharacterized protein n=1 Tax=Snodgrassella alvi TaxID=1196083 RepID=A0ABD7Z2V7_9NEIS|nr:hypothetical protein [Snodgrassella alvi]AHN29276.1 hypothetical protein SALWKB2_1894 [Snodgrassella alvi wkB2]PIT44520.1 hypothetical protein BHC45_06480 [Snodgrassella alvi]UOO97704.1 hypothetical protein LVJ87_06400 [Snodgrassella alvi wkB2]WLS98352.1 hypothetical protein RAM05_11000 [Snodgrassella alvi]
MNTEFQFECTGVWRPFTAGQTYYYVDLTVSMGYSVWIWTGDSLDSHYAYLNHAFPTWQQADQAHLLAIEYLASNQEKFGFMENEPREGQTVWISNSLYPFWSNSIAYDSSDKLHKQLFKNHILHATEEGAINAAKGLVQFLRKETAQNYFKPLTKAPQNGTKVYVADVTAKDGYKYIIYNSEFEYLLNDRLLFSNMLGAIRASTAMRQLINPPILDTTKKPEPDKQ